MNLGRLIDAARYPHKWSAMRYLLSRPSLLLGLSRRPSKLYLSKAIEEFLGRDLPGGLSEAAPEPIRRRFKSGGASDEHGWRFLLYLLVRRYRPEVFVETGVSRGASTAYILAAMHENGLGRLYSIDLPPADAAVVPASGEGGAVHRLSDGQWFHPQGVADLVPDEYKDRWTLILGDARAELPKLLDRLGAIDVFFHDSLHTYDHMMFEFEAAWPRIRPGGLLLSHDVIWNRAWREFAKRVGARPPIYHSLSVIHKKGGPAPATPGPS